MEEAVGVKKEVELAVPEELTVEDGEEDDETVLVGELVLVLVLVLVGVSVTPVAPPNKTARKKNNSARIYYRWIGCSMLRSAKGGVLVLGYSGRGADAGTVLRGRSRPRSEHRRRRPAVPLWH